MFIFFGCLLHFFFYPRTVKFSLRCWLDHLLFFFFICIYVTNLSSSSFHCCSFLPSPVWHASSFFFSLPLSFCDSLKTDVCLFNTWRPNIHQQKSCLMCETACVNKANTIRGIPHLCLSMSVCVCWGVQTRLLEPTSTCRDWLEASALNALCFFHFADFQML